MVNRRKIIIPAVCICTVGIYIAGMKHYEKVFLPGTKVAGISVSGLSVEGAVNKVNAELPKHAVLVKERDREEKVSAEDVGLQYEEIEQSVSDFLGQQDNKGWFLELLLRNKKREIYINKNVDDEAIENLNLAGFSTEAMIVPVDAYLTQTDSGFEIVPEVLGTTLDVEKAKSMIKEAFLAEKSEIDIEECYENPEITSEDSGLKEQKSLGDKYLTTNITISDRGIETTVGKTEILSFLSVKDNKIEMNDTAIKKYVEKTLDPLFDTIEQERTLILPSSDTPVVIGGGNYGYLVSTADELEKIKEEITDGVTETRTPCYKRTEKSSDNGGIGNTYIDVSIEKQHVWLVKDGQVFFETDTVTGSVTGGHATPTGVYFVEFKRTEYEMKTYNAFVHYWMPIDTRTGVGLHDATWRNKFGGDIYYSNGSHGCINLPYEAAKTIFENISSGIPVIVH